MIDGHVNSIGNIAAGLSEDGELAASVSEHGKITGTVNAIGQCSGKINGSAVLSGTLSAGGTIAGHISQPDQSSYDIYGGPYEVTPTNNRQMLYTDNKLMNDDVTINKIPYYETSNPTGTTVYIGG